MFKFPQTIYIRRIWSSKLRHFSRNLNSSKPSIKIESSRRAAKLEDAREREKGIFECKEYNQFIYRKTLNPYEKLKSEIQVKGKKRGDAQFEEVLKNRGVGVPKIKSTNTAGGENTETELKSIIDDLEKEISDEAADEKINFLPPPQELYEKKNIYKQVNRSYSKIKSELAGVESEPEDNSNEYLIKAPPGIRYKVLKYPQTNSTIFVLGVERRSGLHAIFVHDMQPNATVLDIAPDMPYFLKGNGDFRYQWMDFIKYGEKVSFYTSSNPKYLSDVQISPRRSFKLLNNMWQHSHNDFELGTKVLYSSSKNLVQPSLQPDSMLTPFLYIYNNPETEIPIYLSKFPTILDRERIYKKTRKEELIEILKVTSKQIGEKRSEFSVENYKPSIFLSHRMKYTTEILRQVSLAHKRILFLCDYKLLEFISEEWKRLPPSPRHLQGLLNLTNNNTNTKTNQIIVDTLMNHVEKHVILELLLDPFVTQNFTLLQSYPFNVMNTMDWEGNLISIFSMWEDALRRYQEILSLDISAKHNERVMEDALKDIRHISDITDI